MSERVLAGRYRLVDPIGRGGMGVVWRARDETLGREVAVKEVLLAGDLPESERSELYRRAIREARAAALLDHPGIVTVHDVVTEDDRPWIVMELISGVSLDRAAPMPPQVVAAIGLRILAALRVAHLRGILHRDVKPTNILLADDGRVVLTDFGIASLEGDPSLTRTGVFVGSPGFVAPERLREQPVGPASDLWSLGATLYAAVEGRPPFARDTPMAALGAVLADDAPSPVRAGPLAPVLWHLLVKDPATRISAGEAERALGQVAAGMPPGLRVPQPPPPVRRRRRVGPPLAVAVALMLLATAVTVAFRLRGADHPRHRPTTSPTSLPAAAPAASPSPSGSAARHVSPFDFCSLLSARQVSELIPHATKFPVDDAHSCGWGRAARHQGILVSAELVYDSRSGYTRDDPWLTTPADAHREFEQQHAADRKGSDDLAWGWDEIGVRRSGVHESGARRVSGVGDEAYADDAFHGAAMERTTVTFRDSNLFMSLWFVSADGTADAAKIRQNALKAAGWVSEALRRQP
jgi:serine/threonine protein kinase